MTRFVICIAVNAKSIEESYSCIFNFMKELPSCMDWESTDEAYYSDGTPVSKTDLQNAIMQTLEKQLNYHGNNTNNTGS